MNRQEKIAYLSRFEKAFEHYEYLRNEVEGLKSVDYNHVRSSVHRTLTDKIHEKDLAYNSMMKTRKEIEDICVDNIFLDFRFVLMKSYQEIADILGCSSSTVRKKINKSLDELEI